MRCPNKAVLTTKCHIFGSSSQTIQKAGARRFSILDIYKGYLNMVLHPDSREITTHHTPRGPRRFTCMNYSTKSAAETFQKEISNLSAAFLLKNEHFFCFREYQLRILLLLFAYLHILA